MSHASSRSSLFVAGLMLAAACFSAPTAAQDSAPPRIGKSAPPAAKPAGKTPAAKTAPQTPESRARALANLYALLATADNADIALPITEAIERQWLDSGSDTVALLMQRARTAADEKRFDLAEQLLDAVVELKPDYAEAFNHRAFVHYQQSDMQRALGDLHRALALEPNHYKALDGLAQVLSDAGEKKAALKALQQLQTVHPHWQGLSEALTDLEREIEGQGI